MSKTVRFKLSEEEYRVVTKSAKGLGVSIDVLAKQALAYTLQQARELAKSIQEVEDAASEDSSSDDSVRDDADGGNK